MNSRSFLSSPILALGFAAGALAQPLPGDVASIAGVYSSAHKVMVDGVKLETTGYIEIDPGGRIAAFEQKGEGPASIGAGCYVLAAGTMTNAGLQGRLLTPGIAPRGDAVFQTLAGDADIFGILATQNATGQMRWFFHWGKPNSTVNLDGNWNVVNAANQATYSISGPPLDSPTPEQLRGMLCRPGE